MLDALVLTGGAVYLIVGSIISWVLWPRVASVLPGSPMEFADRFGRLAGLSRGILTGLATMTTVLILVAIFREGGVASRRGRLRLLAIVALVASGLISALGLDPATQAVLQAARTRRGRSPSWIAHWNTGGC